MPPPTGTVPPAITPPAGGPSSPYGGSTGPSPFTAQASLQPTNTGTTNLLSPDISTISNYSLGTLETGNVDLGGIGGVSGPNTSIGQALNDFYDLPQGELIQLEQALWQAGFYTDASGAPLQSAPQFGTPDAAAFRAYAMALITTNNARQTNPNVSVTDVLRQRVSAGVGTKDQIQLPSGVIGGGNNYSIDLTNPADVNFTADQIAQKLLGRNANASEKQSILSVLQGQQRSAGDQKVANSEQAAQATYQANVNRANSDFQYQTTPKLANGPVPLGSNIHTSADFAIDLLTYMKVPVTQSNVQAITAWANKTNSGALNNPLGATLSAQGATPGAGGAQNYANWQTAISATAEELMANYPQISTMLQTGTTNLSDSKVAGELSKWSNGGFTSVDNNEGGAAAQASQSLKSNSPAPAQAPTPGSGAAANLANQVDVNGTLPVSPGQFAPATNATSGGQQQSNPADAYVPASVAYVTSPASADAVAYQTDTTGANRPEYLGNNYLNLYQALIGAIKGGGPAAQ